MPFPLVAHFSRALYDLPSKVRHPSWRGGRVVECGALEKRCASDWRTGSSNLSPSVSSFTQFHQPSETPARRQCEHASSAVCRSQSAAANPQPRTGARAKLAPVQPRTKRFQAVNSGMAVPGRHTRPNPRIPLNHAEKGPRKPKDRRTAKGAENKRRGFRDRRIQPLCHPSRATGQRLVDRPLRERTEHHATRPGRTRESGDQFAGTCGNPGSGPPSLVTSGAS
jgi:hypothetical protein